MQMYLYVNYENNFLQKYYLINPLIQNKLNVQLGVKRKIYYW